MRRPLASWIQVSGAHLLDALGPYWQTRLTRYLFHQPPARADGATLDSQLQLLLAARTLILGQPLPALLPAAGRQRARQEAAAATGRPIPVGSTRDLQVPGPGGPLAARHYAPPTPSNGARPDAPDPAPLLVFLHGGGFVIGDLDTHDQACRMLCRVAGVHVLAVDYRLAPEHPFPAAVDDAVAAFRWAAAHAAELGADPERVAVGGDSAGGNLSAVVALLTAHDGGPAPALQVLIYPSIDRTSHYPSMELFADGFFLTRDEIDWFERQYISRDQDDDPRINPIKADDLSGLAPALIITAGFDPLRDEGEAYAKALGEAGVEVTLLTAPSLVHGFINMIDVSRSCRTALADIAYELRGMLTHLRMGEHASS